MYALILRKWIAGKLTSEQVDLLAHTGYITTEQSETIKQTAVTQ